MDFGHTNTNPFSQSQDVRAKRSIRECISAIIMILDTTSALIEHGQCYGSFWSTQYVALVAISTLYVLLIQGVRHALPGDMESFLNVDECFENARKCHDHLATLPPPGTQAERHHVLLAHLRTKVEKVLRRRRNQSSSLAELRNHERMNPDTQMAVADPNQHNTTRLANLNDSNLSPPQSGNSQRVHNDIYTPDLTQTIDAGQEALDEISMFSSTLTPNSTLDMNFQYMLDFGWESLDTIGANMRGLEMYQFGLS